MKRISSIEELKQLCIKNSESINYDGRGIDCFVSFGFLKSSIIIDYCDGTFYMFNEIDDTNQEVEEEDLDLSTNIIKAIERGSLFLYEND